MKHTDFSKVRQETMELLGDHVNEILGSPFNSNFCP